MANRDLLADAIADAKAVKEVAIANAKAALEEAFTPHLKDMLAQKINEIEEIDEVEEISEESRKERAKVDKYEYEKGKLKGQNKFDKEVSTKIDETEEMDEGYGKESMDEEKEMEEEINLDELLAELELEEDITGDGDRPDQSRSQRSNQEKQDLMQEELDEAKEEISEESRAERADVDKYEYEKGKEAGEDDDVDLDDMSEEELKNMIEDVIEDMVNSGELEAGGDAVEMADTEDEEVDVTVDVTDTEEIELEENARTDAEQEGYKDGFEDAKDDIEAELKKMKVSEELNEAKEVINHLRSELNEVNLLNSKLLYTNKIFKSKNLTENQKIKVLKAFDKAETVKEAKNIFEALNENLVAKSIKSNIRESLGMASKPAGVAPKRPLNENVIQEDAMVARFKKLAGIN